MSLLLFFLCRGIWPATLLFSPLEKYGAFSYADVMITPLAEAMRDAIAKAKQMGKLYTPPDASRPVVYMALQGKLLLVALPVKPGNASLLVALDTVCSTRLVHGMCILLPASRTVPTPAQ
jgi:hypothetical protein